MSDSSVFELYNSTYTLVPSTPPPVYNQLNTPTWQAAELRRDGSRRYDSQDVTPLIFMESYNALLCTIFIVVLFYLRYKLPRWKNVTAGHDGCETEGNWKRLSSERCNHSDIV